MSIIVETSDVELVAMITEKYHWLISVAPPPLGVQLLITDDYPYAVPGVSGETWTKRGKMALYAPQLRGMIKRTGVFAESAPNWQMPIRNTDPIGYVVAHEWGHLRQPVKWCPKRTTFLSGIVIRPANIQPDDFSDVVIESLSLYGRTSKGEAFAEAFAEWYGTNGQTLNVAAQYFADRFSWNI